jgi:hypothetical protein
MGKLDSTCTFKLYKPRLVVADGLAGVPARFARVGAAAVHGAIHLLFRDGRDVGWVGEEGEEEEEEEGHSYQSRRTRLVLQLELQTKLKLHSLMKLVRRTRD